MILSVFCMIQVVFACFTYLIRANFKNEKSILEKSMLPPKFPPKKVQKLRKMQTRGSSESYSLTTVTKQQGSLDEIPSLAFDDEDFGSPRRRSTPLNQRSPNMLKPRTKVTQLKQAFNSKPGCMSPLFSTRFVA